MRNQNKLSSDALETLRRSKRVDSPPFFIHRRTFVLLKMTSEETETNARKRQLEENAENKQKVKGIQNFLEVARKNFDESMTVCKLVEMA